MVQLHEVSLPFYSDDNSVPPGGSLQKYQENLLKAVRLAGVQDVTPQLEGYLLDAGFTDVRVVVKKLPLGPWAKDKKKKELGMWGLAISEEGLRAYGLALFTRQLGLSPEEATALCDGAFAELSRRQVHTYVAQ